MSENPLAERARQMYVPYVVGYKEIARRLGVSAPTVRRWLNPDAAERNRILSREAKRRARGTCSDCGAVTRYGGRPGKRVSTLCPECASRRSLYWTRERIIESIRGWEQKHGRPPHATDWLFRVDKTFPHPPASTVQLRFGSWAEAIEAAGFERPQPGGRYRERPELWKFDHAEALRLVQEGLTYQQVADRLGVSRNTIANLVHLGGTFAKKRS